VDTDTRLDDDATLRFFCRDVDVAKVEAERFPSLAAVRRESLGGADHLAMLLVHEFEVAKFALARAMRAEAEEAAAEDAAVFAEASRIRAARRREQRRAQGMRRRERDRASAGSGFPSIADSLAAHRSSTEAAT